MYSYPNKVSNQNDKNKVFNNGLKSYKIEIEYEKISPKLNSQLNPQDENENFNVYFMKPDFKYKTISTSNSLTNSKIKKFNQNKADKNKEKEFKSHLIQKLKSLKLNQSSKDKIPLNIASKIRREESIRNSLKYLLAKQSQYDPKKELMYYKAYFRFWKRKCKYDKYNNKRIIKKDKNIRITTVIYRADKPNKYLSNNIIEESKNENTNKKRNNFFRNKLIRIMESKSKDKVLKRQDKEENEINIKEKNLNKENKKNVINNINIYSQASNNIKTIKNVTNINNEDNNVQNNFYSLNKKFELTNSRKEALNKIDNNIKKEFKVEGFNRLKKFRNKSREKEGTELLNNIFIKNNKKYKEEAINKIKENVNDIDIINNFDIEGEKWTVNKFNWQVEELNKDKDSLYGLSDEELKDSNNQNNININMNQTEENNNLNHYNNNVNLVKNNADNPNQKQSKIQKITSQPLSDENVEEGQEEEEYEIIQKDQNENLENEENNDYNGEEYINYEEIENNNYENDEEDNGEEEQEQYNYEEGNEEYNYEEANLEEEYIDENEMEEMVEEIENSQKDGLDYLKDEVEEMDNEEEGNENKNNGN